MKSQPANDEITASVTPSPVSAMTEPGYRSPAPANDIAALTASVAALANMLAMQAQSTQSLIAVVRGQEAPAPVPAAANNDGPNVRRVMGRHNPVDQKFLGDYMTPLGDGRAYNGEIFGVTRRRQTRVAAVPTTAPRLTLVIGDSHFHPGLTDRTVRCMTLAGLHASAIKPAHVVHIGDGGDWSSVCQHVRNETWKAREKPSLRQDVDTFRENWNALNRPLDDAGIANGARHYCWGNHDAWLHNFEDAHPELKGLATGELSEILGDAGWSQSDYGEYYWIGGVGYTHVPLNLMGRPVGGQTAENSIAMQSTRDTVLGHTHRYAQARRPKMDGTTVTILNAGSSMPEFYVGEYAQVGQGRSLDYGVLEVVDFDGRIQSHRFVTMRELEARYGADADRRLS